MADNPDTPAKRGRPKKDPTSPKIAKAKPVKDLSMVPAKSAPVHAAPLKNAATRKAAVSKGNGAAAGWSAQIAPFKAKAEKAARDVADKVKDVDWKAHVDPLKEQAAKTAKSAAGIAKDKTGTAMQSLAKLISETAGTVDAKLGPQYGDYARQAAESVAGAAKSLDGKDVDMLMSEARDFVRKSPAMAIGAAAVVGYVLMRLAKGSSDE
jgi:ElaB/YqjD/DUF883 family membrane-anchored ribosome-binding protein